MKNGCNLEEKVELDAQEQIDSFSKFLENDEAAAKDQVEKSKDEDDDKMEIDEKSEEEEEKYVTLLREDGVEEILSRYSALLVQKRPKEGKRILVESEKPKGSPIKTLSKESGTKNKFPTKTLPQPKHRSQQPIITVDQVYYNLNSRIQIYIYHHIGQVYSKI